MTDILDRLRAATEGTTPGPYIVVHYVSGENSFAEIKSKARRTIAEARTTKDRDEVIATFELFALSRSLIPEAADSIAVLRAEVEALRAEKRAAWEACRDAAVKTIEPADNAHPDVRRTLRFAQGSIRALTPPEV